MSACSTTVHAEDKPVEFDAVPKGRAVAIFAGGCFWCMEKPFDKLDGVTATVSGYTGGPVISPTYEQVSAGSTGHTEAIQITYDPKKISYDELLTVFWHNIDPLDAKGQFCDRGTQYRPGLFPRTPEEIAAAEKSVEAISAELGKTLGAKIEPPAKFWSAEEYHQNYYLTHPYRYAYYRNACGRDRRLTEVWGEKAGH